MYLDMLGYILDVIMSDQSIPRHHNVLHEPRKILFLSPENQLLRTSDHAIAEFVKSSSNSLWLDDVNVCSRQHLVVQRTRHKSDEDIAFDRGWEDALIFLGALLRLLEACVHRDREVGHWVGCNRRTEKSRSPYGPFKVERN